MEAFLKRLSGRFVALLVISILVLAGIWGLRVSLAQNSTSTLLPATNSVGSLYAWGGNNFGQLGDSTIVSRTTPVTVDTSSLPAGLTFTAVTAGVYHSLALGNDGKLYSWGGNSFGQLGDGTTITRTTPAAVNLSSLPPTLTFTAISAGAYHNLALGSDNKLYAWGYNISGQLGDGSTTQRNTPVAVNMNPLPAGLTFTTFDAGLAHSLAVGSNGKLYAWGSNSQYQVGDGTIINRSSPVAVSSSPAITGQTFLSVAAGSNHSLALSSNGKLYAWGYNTSGQLGDGTTVSQLGPVTVTLSALPPGLSFTAIDAGNFHNLALGNDGKIYSWGLNSSGQLGDNTTTQRNSPVSVVMSSLPANLSFTSVAAGSTHSLALGNDGKLYTWGGNGSGQLGDGTTTNRLTPVTVNLLAGATPSAVAGGTGWSLAVLPLPTITANNIIQSESNIGSSNPLTFTFNLSYATNQPVTVQYATADGTATTLDNDYVPISGTLTFTPGQITNTVSVLVNGDNTYEANETFFLTLTNPSNALLGPSGLVTATILNDDPFPVISTGNVTRLEGNSGTTSFDFPIVLTTASYQTITVGYIASDNTATALDNDYVPISGTLTIPPGALTSTITVLVNGDTKVEPDETFTLNLFNPTGANLGIPSVAVGTILNDDIPCNPLLVTKLGDDGSCGTLRAALDFVGGNITKTINIQLPANSVISLTTGLTLPTGVVITTAAPCSTGLDNSMLPPIIIQGVDNSSGSGLTLAGNNQLYGLWVRGFSAVQIKTLAGSSTKMQCVKASKF